MQDKPCKTFWSTLVLLVFGVAGAPGVVASTVVPMSIQTMADHAGQVVSGTVIGVRSYFIDSPRGIETEVTLGGVEYLKGSLSGSTTEMTLRVPGGVVGEMQMRICCAPEPRIGEKWILFLLPTYRTYPTVGLFQGAFRVVTDATGIERIYRGAGEPVTGFGADGMIQINGVAPMNRHLHHAGGEVPAVTIPDRTVVRVDAMTLADFRAQLTPILAASKPHALAAQAGRRVSTPYHARAMHQLDAATASIQTDSPKRTRSELKRSKESRQLRRRPTERPR